MGRSAAGPPGHWYLGPNALPTAESGRPLPYPGALPCDPGLGLLVLDRGAELGRSGPWVLRRYGYGVFPVDTGSRVWSPLPSAVPFLRYWADSVLAAPRGRIYVWAGLCASEDDDGAAGPLYGTFDDWLWGEATRVDSGILPGAGRPPARYHLHLWSGSYFVSVDPLPAPFLAFDSRNTALIHAARMAGRTG